jgi:hypothetical protein
VDTMTSRALYTSFYGFQKLSLPGYRRSKAKESDPMAQVDFRMTSLRPKVIHLLPSFSGFPRCSHGRASGLGQDRSRSGFAVGSFPRGRIMRRLRSSNHPPPALRSTFVTKPEITCAGSLKCEQKCPACWVCARACAGCADCGVSVCMHVHDLHTIPLGQCAA